MNRRDKVVRRQRYHIASGRDCIPALEEAVAKAEAAGYPAELPWRLSHGMESGMRVIAWLEDNGIAHLPAGGIRPSLILQVNPPSPARKLLLRLRALMPEAGWVVSPRQRHIFAHNIPQGWTLGLTLNEGGELNLVVFGRASQGPLQDGGEGLLLVGQDLDTPAKREGALLPLVSRWEWLRDNWQEDAPHAPE
jgi:hypothetical protein